MDMRVSKEDNLCTLDQGWQETTALHHPIPVGIQIPVACRACAELLNADGDRNRYNCFSRQPSDDLARPRTIAEVSAAPITDARTN